MAYLDLELNLPRGALEQAQTRATPRHDPVSRLSMLERQVIQLARTDGRWSLAGSGRFQSVLATVLGLERPNPLADPRLEALRRYAVTLRLSAGRLPRADDDRLIAFGFSSAAITDIRRLVLDTVQSVA